MSPAASTGFRRPHLPWRPSTWPARRRTADDARPVLSDSTCFLHHELMQDWNRLGKYVVARRVKLGYDVRMGFASAAQITTRVLSDIENGRRGNYDQVTVAKLEDALGWQTGSAIRVLEGGEPWLKDQTPSASTDASLNRLLLDGRSTEDEALARVMRSNLTDVQKQEVRRILIAEREAAERRRTEHAEELIRLLSRDHT